VDRAIRQQWTPITTVYAVNTRLSANGRQVDSRQGAHHDSKPNEGGGSTPNRSSASTVGALIAPGHRPARPNSHIIIIRLVKMAMRVDKDYHQSSAKEEIDDEKWYSPRSRRPSTLHRGDRLVRRAEAELGRGCHSSVRSVSIGGLGRGHCSPGYHP
jgi:hypothetical protein